MGAPWEKYQQQTAESGPWSKYAKAEQPKPEKELGTLETIGAALGKGVGDVVLGGQGLLGKGLKSLGAENAGQWLVNDATRGKEALAQQFSPYKEANPVTAGVGEFAGNVVGTLPVGGGLAAVARPVLAGAGSVGLAILNALRSSGASVGPANALSPAANLAIRSGAGATTGGASAALLNPEDAQTGAVIGGALPVVGRFAENVKKSMRGPEQSQALADAITKARDAGYVIPPTQAKGDLLNRTLEGAAGKITTSQNASAANQEITNRLASRAIGLPDDVKITPEILKSIRSQAGKAYEAIGGTGDIVPSKAYSDALDKIAEPFVKSANAFPNAKVSPVLEIVDSLRSPQFDSAAAVEKVKQLRTASEDAFRTGNTDIARASRSAANALEDAIEKHLQDIGQPELLNNFRAARQLIAKTHTVEKALNPETGTINAKKLSAELQKKKPLSGELKQIAEFGLAFPKASQAIEGMGSLPQWSPLDLVAGAGLATMAQDPRYAAIAAIRPGARALALSPAIQNRLIQQPLKTNNMLNTLIYKSAPIAGAQ